MKSPGQRGGKPKKESEGQVALPPARNATPPKTDTEETTANGARAQFKHMMVASQATWQWPNGCGNAIIKIGTSQTVQARKLYK